MCGLALVASLASAQNFNNTPTTKPTGRTLKIVQNTMVALPTAEVRTSTAPRSESVLLLQPVSLEVPSFASDFTAAVMTEEMAAQMDAQFLRNMRLLVTVSGMELVDRDTMARDRGANRPMLLPLYNEILIRQQMARSMRTYMLARGLPRFLGSREETKAIAQAYQGVQNATRLQVQRPNSKWAFGTGINPFESKTWANVHNGTWRAEVVYHYNVDQLRSTLAHTWKAFLFETNYFIFSKVLEQHAVYRFSPTLTSRLTLGVPLMAQNKMGHSTTTLRMEKTF